MKEEVTALPAEFSPEEAKFLSHRDLMRKYNDLYKFTGEVNRILSELSSWLRDDVAEGVRYVKENAPEIGMPDIIYPPERGESIGKLKADVRAWAMITVRLAEEVRETSRELASARSELAARRKAEPA